jgi:tRNA(fMet)-specific endonuclease VapC
MRMLTHRCIGRSSRRSEAIALAIDATVVTRNRLDFELVPGLRIVDWSEP